MNTIEKLRVLKQVVKDTPDSLFDMHVVVWVEGDKIARCALGALAMSDMGKKMRLSVEYTKDHAEHQRDVV